jgi:alpha-L-fucosidase
MEWWRDARFGMFIHWGLYSIPAGEWNGTYTKTAGEWIMDGLKIPASEYEKFAGQFNPTLFNARDWVLAAKNAGMKYIVITTKHHDGFCLWPTKYTDWSVKSTPFKRDPLKELAEACREYGIKLCFYYSIMDWHYPYYPEPRPWNDRTAKNSDMDKYVNYMKSEIKELIDNYGPIGILWFDGEWERTLTEDRAEDLAKYIMKLQPDIIINNRIGKARSGMHGFNDPNFKPLGDYGTPEQEIPSTGIKGYDWETCMTMNDTWGYRKDDNNWKSSATLIYNLIDITSKGGNFLLNVGPTASGEFPEASKKALKDIGEWMKINGESVYHTKASPFNKLAWGRCTQKETENGAQLYLHILDYPANNKIQITGLVNKINRAYLLSDNNKNNLNVSGDNGITTIELPGKQQDYYNVVVLDIQGKPEVINAPEIITQEYMFIDSTEVNIKNEHAGTEIKYTLDGTMPEVGSKILKDKINITDNAVFTACYFKSGHPVSDTTRAVFTRAIPAPPAAVENLSPGIKYNYYEGEWDKLPDFSSLNIIHSGIAPDFTIDIKDKSKEHYAIVYNGYIKIPEEAVYTFYLNSDDGTILYIDGKLLIDNDGIHSGLEKSSSTALAKGSHEIKVKYLQGSGDSSLKVSVETKNTKKMIIPVSWLFY